mmetsp:Transcript_65948/g.155785  ORF Transcript_65948/g.155785 Transcript_65948/m.155785 type:complete len:129 (-) Transcript_65948:195-581(-)
MFAAFAMAVLHVTLQVLTAWSILEARSKETPTERLYQLELSSIMLKMLLHEHTEHLCVMQARHELSEFIERIRASIDSCIGRQAATPEPPFPPAETNETPLLKAQHLPEAPQVCDCAVDVRLCLSVSV